MSMKAHMATGSELIKKTWCYSKLPIPANLSHQYTLHNMLRRNDLSTQ